MFRNFLAGLLTALVISFALPASAGIMAVTAACKNDWLQKNHYSEQDARHRVHPNKTIVNGVIIDGLKIRSVWDACLTLAKDPQFAAVQQSKLAPKAVAPVVKRPIPAVSATQQRTAPAVVAAPKKVPALLPKPVITPASVDKTVASAEQPAIKELTNAQRVAYGLLVETPPPAKPEVVVTPAPADAAPPKNEQVQTDVLNNWRLPSKNMMLAIAAGVGSLVLIIAIGFLAWSGNLLPLISGLIALLTHKRSSRSHVFTDIEPYTAIDASLPGFKTLEEGVEASQPEPALTAIVALETAPEAEPVEQAAPDEPFVELEEAEQPSPVAFHPSLVEDNPLAVSPQVENPYQLRPSDLEASPSDEDTVQSRRIADVKATLAALDNIPSYASPDPLDGLPDKESDDKHKHAA